MKTQDLDLFGTPLNTEVVNVASVPQRSPFRYPGGKTWLIPIVRRWLLNRRAKNKELMEPFAGGGIVALTAVAEGLVEKATMIELDEDVAAVWETILGKDGMWLADEILKFDLNQKSVVDVLSKSTRSTRRKAFATILKNRVSHGGILANGSGLLKHGENGKGIHSRWYPITLKRRILDILLIKDRIDFHQGDGISKLKRAANREDVVFFIDPPYTVAGKRLYKYPDINHTLLFEVVERLKGDFLITYDNAPEIRNLAEHYKFDMRLVPMMNTHHATKMELLIGNDLSSLDV